jgi:uroporphyrinogen-III synthase
MTQPKAKNAPGTGSPLEGKRVVLTREPTGNERLADPLKALGAEIISLPLITTELDLDRERAEAVFKEFASYEWLVFTSRNGVRGFFEAFLSIFSDIRSLGFVRLAVIGEGTQEALREYHLKADLLPQKATSEALCKALAAEQTLDNIKVLLITGDRNEEDLEKALWEERAIVDSLRVYRTQLVDLDGDSAASDFRIKGADALLFASASAVEAFGNQAENLRLEANAAVPVLGSFGPKTTERMKRFGIPVALEADPPGIEGMLAALVSYFADKKSP